MPRYKPDHTPKYRHHKQSGKGIVTLNGRDFLLGEYGSSESKQAYHDLLKKWEAGGRQPLDKSVVVIATPETPAPPMSVADVVSIYSRHIEAEYPEGNLKMQLQRIRGATRHLVEKFGDKPARDFSPLKLKEVRKAMIASGLVRSTINAYVRIIVDAFRWVATEELISDSIYRRLESVEPLKKRWRTGARSTGRKQIVPTADITAVQHRVGAPVWALIRLQLACGARPGELVKLRAIDIDTSDDIWLYNVAEHKTEHHDHTRTIAFGQQAQAIIKPFMANRPVDAFLFDPRESIMDLKAKRSTKGKRRRIGQKPNRRETERRVNDRYSVESYRRAIARACESAGVPVWSPHRLRRTFANNVKRKLGPEESRVLLGHSSLDTTAIYLNKSIEELKDYARRIG